MISALMSVIRIGDFVFSFDYLDKVGGVILVIDIFFLCSICIELYFLYVTDQ